MGARDLYRQALLDVLGLILAYAEIAIRHLEIGDDAGALMAMRKLLMCCRSMTSTARDLRREHEHGPDKGQ